MPKLVNKVAIITGSGRGIGRSIALRFGREGALVMTADLDAKSAEATADEILTFGGQARSKSVDVGVQAEVQELVASAIQAWERIDVLVNVAGIGLTKLFINTTLEQWE